MNRYSRSILIASVGIGTAVVFRLTLSSRVGLTFTSVNETLFTPLNHVAFWTALLVTVIAVVFSVRERASF